MYTQSMDNARMKASNFGMDEKGFAMDSRNENILKHIELSVPSTKHEECDHLLKNSHQR